MCVCDVCVTDISVTCVCVCKCKHTHICDVCRVIFERETVTVGMSIEVNSGYFLSSVYTWKSGLLRRLEVGTDKLQKSFIGSTCV